MAMILTVIGAATLAASVIRLADFLERGSRK